MTDRSKQRYNSCSAVIGSLTNAQRAQKALAQAAIPSSVAKSETAVSQRGCVWSIYFACNQGENVRSVLSAAGINVRAWNNGYDIS